MSRKARYSKELKLEIVKRYLNGESPVSLANEYGLSTSGKVRIWRWGNKYRTLGEKAFEETTTNKYYSKEFKIKVIEEYLSGLNSYVKASSFYKMHNKKYKKQYNYVYEYFKEMSDKEIIKLIDLYVKKHGKTIKKGQKTLKELINQ